jgi:proteasome accessory factor C
MIETSRRYIILMQPSRPARGIKRASTLASRRRLAVVRRLVRGPALADDLIAVIDAELPPSDSQAARSAALRHDLRAIRQDWGCQIRYQPQLGYVLQDLGVLAVLDLPDEAMQGLTVLLAAYPDSSEQPTHQQVRQLLACLQMALPPERRDEVLARRPELRIVGPEARYRLHTPTLQTIRRALGRQYLRFDYAPAYRPGVEQHRAAPLELLLRDSHTYLLAYCAEPPRPMEECYGGYVEFRVDQIVAGTLRVLPTRLPPCLPPRPSWQIVYELAPVIARHGHVAHWFPATEIAYRDDGSALVTATVYSLWQARQILLRYLENVRVLSPPELIALMRETIQKLSMLYEA